MMVPAEDFLYHATGVHNLTVNGVSIAFVMNEYAKYLQQQIAEYQKLEQERAMYSFQHPFYIKQGRKYRDELVPGTSLPADLFTKE